MMDNTPSTYRFMIVLLLLNAVAGPVIDRAATARAACGAASAPGSLRSRRLAVLFISLLQDLSKMCRDCGFQMEFRSVYGIEWLGREGVYGMVAAVNAEQARPDARGGQTEAAEDADWDRLS
ncbi:MAG TPA: hypothetical protein VEK15_06365 [Vicinamibacteria bacterium]|nr:hypothetical protein [Vicinamibacteria bacterium]